MEFTDCFSKQAKQYAQFRPTYPTELFSFLNDCVAQHDWAWDCATGSGQAANGLAPYFKKITATDPSLQQLENAVQHLKINYHVATAEESGLPAGQIDLVTAATAAHWFDLDRFYTEVKRVLKPKGVVALWSYGFNDTVDSAAVGQILNRYQNEIVKPYFRPEIQRLWNGYQNLPFPFQEISAPSFEMRVEWNYEQTMGYLLSWSATQAYIERQGKDPRQLIEAELSKAWGDPQSPIGRTWEIGMRVGQP